MTTALNLPALLTEEEAAAWLRIAPRTLRANRDKWGVRCIILGARTVRYRLEDLTEYAEQCARAAAVDPQPVKVRMGRAGLRGGNVVPFSQRKRPGDDRL